MIDWAIDNLQKGKTINLYKNAFTSAIDVRSFARIACEIFFDYKTRGLLNLCCREVFSKELLIRTISQRLNLKHKHCPSVEIETHDKLRANCLGLDVTRAERILDKPLPNLDEVVHAICKDFMIDEGK